MAKQPAVAIDLGASYSRIGLFKNEKFEIIDIMGAQKLPMIIAFTETEILIGEAAKGEAIKNASNTVFDIKSLIGKRFDDPSIEFGMKHWPFTIKNIEGIPKIEVSYKSRKQLYYPEEILSFFISKMKEAAESYLGETVKDFVFTVPASFNNAQRQAVKDAGSLAGINTIRLLNDPMAAAITFYLNQITIDHKIVLILNCGNAAADVTVFQINEKLIEAISTMDGDFGGKKIDQNMASCLVNSTVTPDLFEDLNADLFDVILKLVEKAIQYAGIDKMAIDDIVLIGGSTNIPQLEQLLRSFFNGKEPNTSINPDEAVIYGSTVQAVILNDNKLNILDFLQKKNENVKDLLFVDIVPKSLSILVFNGLSNIIVKKNTSIPVEETFTLQLSSLKEPIFIEIFEGEHNIAQNNNLLGKFEIMSSNANTVNSINNFEVELTFSVDADGIFKLSAQENQSAQSLQIKTDKLLFVMKCPICDTVQFARLGKGCYYNHGLY